ncbi:MAG: hypothetical protein RLZZ175_57 [Bacteroidota bacterium]|jgi:lipoprotein NlpI
MKDLDKALYDLNIAIGLNPQNPNYYNLRGEVKLESNDILGSIEDFNKAILIDDSFNLAFYNRGLSKIKLNKKDEACIDFQRALELEYKEASKMIEKHCKK